MKNRRGMFYFFAAALSISTLGLMGMPKYAVAGSAFECFTYEQWKHDVSFWFDDHIHGHVGSPPVPAIWEYENTFAVTSDPSNHEGWVIGKVSEDGHATGLGCSAQ